MNDQKGILTAGDDKYKKYNANVNISSNITKWLNVSAKITHTYTSELHHRWYYSDEPYCLLRFERILRYDEERLEPIDASKAS